MLVVGLGFVVEEGVERVELGRVGVDPGADVFGLAIDGAAVVAAMAMSGCLQVVSRPAA